MSCFYHAGRVAARIILSLFTRWQVKGEENIPEEGALLVVANHVNAADPPLIGVIIKRETVFMAKEELFRSRIIGYFIRSFGAFPVRRGQLDMKAIRLAEQVLAQGMALIMFPEGQRSRQGELRKALPGSALIAARSSVPILPVGIIGTEQLQGMTWPLRRPRITVNIGHTFTLPPVNNRRDKAELVEQTDFIMSRIAELLPEKYQGDWNENRKSE